MLIPIALTECTRGGECCIYRGMFALKASVATSESLYCYLWVFCALSLHTSVTDAVISDIHLIPMCQEKLSLSQITGRKGHSNRAAHTVHSLHSRINRYVTSQTINISQLEARLLATVSVLYCSYMVLYK